MCAWPALARCTDAVPAIIKDLFDLFLTIATIVLYSSPFHSTDNINSRFASVRHRCRHRHRHRLANGIIAAFWCVEACLVCLEPPPRRLPEMAFFFSVDL